MVTRRREGAGRDGSKEKGAPHRSEGDARGFLSRWSERKRAVEAEERSEEPRDAVPAAADPNAVQQGAGGDEDARVDLADLPDVDSLEAGADFSAFMKEGVPASLQRRALRRLWQVDPAFQEICMLDDYNLDYTDAAMVVPNLKTFFQVGRGMVLPEDEAAAEAGPDEAEASAASLPTSAPTLETAENPAPAAAGEGDVTAEEASSGDPVPPAAPPVAARRAARKPGTPIISPEATRTTANRPGAASTTPAGAAASGERRSARHRRWGEPEG
ncbi:MAG: hypothetical protein Tsb0032_14960 [Kiloniellaceae bacterium]